MLTLRRLAAVMVVGPFLGLLLAGCSGDPGKGQFNEQAGDAVPRCQVHQNQMPSKDYTGGPEANTSLVLDVLRYYVKNGNKPFCDGKGPTKVDQAWAKLYLKVGAEPRYVQRIVQTSG
jgi:hypothetical protein